MVHDFNFFQALTCPTSVTWTQDIKGLFTATDIAHMKTKGIDLSSYQSVMINAVQIYSRVSTGSMPPPPSKPWPQAWVDLFGCWIQQGTPEN